jgi:hypothetical protein
VIRESFMADTQQCPDHPGQQVPEGEGLTDAARHV